MSSYTTNGSSYEREANARLDYSVRSWWGYLDDLLALVGSHIRVRFDVNRVRTRTLAVSW